MIVKPLRHRHVEALMRELLEAKVDPAAPFADKTLPEQIVIVGHVNRAAQAAQMLNGTDPGELEPWQAFQLAAQVINATWESLTIPKASESQSPTTSPDAANVPTS